MLVKLSALTFVTLVATSAVVLLVVRSVFKMDLFNDLELDNWDPIFLTQESKEYSPVQCDAELPLDLHGFVDSDCEENIGVTHSTTLVDVSESSEYLKESSSEQNSCRALDIYQPITEPISDDETVAFDP